MSQDCVLIVTGFGSFPGVARNSTAEIVDELRSSINIEGFIKGKVIQVSAVAVLQSLINLHRTIENLTLKGQKVVLLHLGVDSNEKGFRLERRGWNEAHFAPRGDVLNWFPEHQSLIESKPIDFFYESRIDTQLACNHLKSLGFDCKVSIDPGRYLCNNITFHSLRMFRSNPNVFSLFVHCAPFEAVEKSIQLEFIKNLFNCIKDQIQQGQVAEKVLSSH